MTLVHVPSDCVPLNQPTVDALRSALKKIERDLADLAIVIATGPSPADLNRCQKHGMTRVELQGLRESRRNSLVAKRDAIQKTLDELAPGVGAS